MIRSREVNLRAFLLINWFPIQSSCVQMILATTMQYSTQKLPWRAFKSIHFEYPREDWVLILRIHNISMITIWSRQVNLRASVSINWFSISNSDLSCSVDFCHYDAMLEERHFLKSCQIHPFWVCTWWMILIRWIHNNQWNITTSLSVCETNKPVIAVQQSIVLGYWWSTNLH